MRPYVHQIHLFPARVLRFLLEPSPHVSRAVGARLAAGGRGGAAASAPASRIPHLQYLRARPTTTAAFR